VLGTIVLSNLNGQTRYAHINALRGDRVGGEMLGVSKVVSEDSVRRALQRGTPEEWDQWLTTQERAVYEPLLSESYVLDIDDWQGTETTIKLMGWTRPRRCIFLRRSAQRPAPRKALAASTEAEFSFVERLDSGPVYEYIVLVTNDALPIVALAQLYRDRADCENVFDEIKNPWGWAGFVTRDLKRCRIMARLIALIYNWWNVFTRLARPDQLPMSRHDSQSALRCPVTSQESKRALMLLNPKSRCDPVFCEL